MSRTIILLALLLLAGTSLLLLLTSAPTRPVLPLAESGANSSPHMAPGPETTRPREDEDVTRQELEDDWADQPVTITGRCVSGEGPVASATVSVLMSRDSRQASNQNTTTTKADGRFQIGPLPSATYVLKVSAHGHLDHSQNIRLRGTDLDLEEISLTRGCILEGQVVDTKGRPMRGVDLRITWTDRKDGGPRSSPARPVQLPGPAGPGQGRNPGTGGTRQVLRADRDGRYRSTALAPGHYQVTSPHGPFREDVNVEVEAGTWQQTRDFTMQRPAFELHGRVTNDLRQTVGNARVSLVATPEPESTAAATRKPARTVTLHCTADDQGEFSFYADSVPPVPFTIHATAEEHDDRTMEDVWPGHLVQVVLRSGVLLEVHVVDEQRQPVTGFGILLTPPGEKGRETPGELPFRPGPAIPQLPQRDTHAMRSGHHQNGRLQVRMAREQYELMVIPTGVRYGRSLRHPVDLRSGEPKTLVVTVPRTRRVQFQVHFADGTWVDQASLTATATSEDQKPTYAYSAIKEGLATLRIPERVPVNLRVSAQNIEAFVLRDFVAEHDEPKIRVPSGAAISGTIYPHVRGRMQLRRASGQTRIWPSGPAPAVDNQGGFWFSHVPNGHWELWFMPAAPMKAAYKVAVIANLKEGEHRRIACDGNEGATVILEVLLTVEGQPAPRRFFSLRPLEEDDPRARSVRLMTDTRGRMRRTVGMARFSLDVDLMVEGLGSMVVPAQPEVVPAAHHPQVVNVSTAPMVIRVLDGSGQPVAGRRLRLSTGVGPAVLLPESDGEGYVRLAKAPCVPLSLLEEKEEKVVGRVNHHAGAVVWGVTLP